MNVIETPAAPAHTGPVPQAVESGGWIFVSALLGHPDTELTDDPRVEADQLFANLTAILATAGAELRDVVRVGIFMKDLQRDRPVFNDHRVPAAPVRAMTDAESNVPLIVGSFTLERAVIAAIAAWSASETFRIHLNDLGKPDAVPVPQEEYERIRASA